MFSGAFLLGAAFCHGEQMSQEDFRLVAFGLVAFGSVTSVRRFFCGGFLTDYKKTNLFR